MITPSKSCECEACGDICYPDSISVERRAYTFNGERLCLRCALDAAGVEDLYE